MQWLADQPEVNLSVHAELEDSLAMDLTMFDEAIIRNPLHEQVIRGELTRSLTLTLDPVREELLQSLEALWGNSIEWHEVGVWETFTKLVARTSHRIFVGTELC